MIGDSHIHTTFSDGGDTLADMVCAARDAGLDYVVVADHARLSSAYLPAYTCQIRNLRESLDFDVRIGLEVKFLNPDGTLDCHCSWARDLEYLVVSFHTFPFTMAVKERHAAFKSAWFTTLKNFGRQQLPGLRNLNENLKVVLGHPFSMWKLGGITPSEEDITQAIQLANNCGFALEININPKHFIGNGYIDTVIEKADDYTVGSDSHSAGELRVLAPRILSLFKRPCRKAGGRDA